MISVILSMSSLAKLSDFLVFWEKSLEFFGKVRTSGNSVSWSNINDDAKNASTTNQQVECQKSIIYFEVSILNDFV